MATSVESSLLQDWLTYFEDEDSTNNLYFHLLEMLAQPTCRSRLAFLHFLEEIILVAKL